MSSSFLLFFIVCKSLLSFAFVADDLEDIFGQKHCILGSFDTLFSQNIPDVAVLERGLGSESVTTALKNLSSVITEANDKSAVSNLNELAQYNDIEYSYALIAEEGPPHNKLFKIKLTLGDETYEAEASSLKKAKSTVASKALNETEYKHPPSRLLGNDNTLTPTVLLNMYTTFYGLPFSYTLIKKEISASDNKFGKTVTINSSEYDLLRVPGEDAQVSGPFKMLLKISDHEFVGSGDTIQAAKHDAAKKALKNMGQILDKNNVCGREGFEDECELQKNNLKSPISLVHEAAQKLNQNIDFTITEEKGPSHKKVFVTQCKIGDFTSEGEGKSKKESKKNSAENMLENLAHLPQLFAKNNDNQPVKNKKRNKKKKIIKTYGDKLNKVIEDVGKFMWSSETNSPSKKPKTGSSSPKNDLLQIGNLLNIDVQFMDLSKSNGKSLSLASLGTNPSHICLGKGVTKPEASDNAALRAMKFMSKNGIFEDIQEGYGEKESLKLVLDIVGKYLAVEEFSNSRSR